MKYLLPLLFLLAGCAHTPMLEEGSCYKVSVKDILLGTPTMDLAVFKIGKVFTFRDRQEYTVQPLDSFGDPVYPGTFYGYYEVDSFDKNISTLAHPFNFENPESHVVKCNAIKERPPLRITGRKP